MTARKPLYNPTNICINFCIDLPFYFGILK
jgi:hypothetical protein